MNEYVSEEIWDIWRVQHVIYNDQYLLLMMQEISSIIRSLKNMNKNYYSMTINSLIIEWFSLEKVAIARQITSYSQI